MLNGQKTVAGLIKALIISLGYVPRKFAVLLAKLAGWIWFVVDERHRKVALDNLNHAFGHEKSRSEIKELAQRVFHQCAMLLFEIGWSFRVSGDDFLRHCNVEGLSHVKAALEKGKGVIVFSAHTGNWEFVPVPIALAGLPQNVIYRPLDFRPADRVIYEYRTRFGARMTPKRNSMRSVLKSLENNECVGMLLDQDAGLTAGVFADFFGRPACTNKGLALLALKTGAAVIPAFTARVGSTFLIEYQEEIPLINTGDKEKDIEANTQQYNKKIEAFVRRYPEQWLWIHRRWKNQPSYILS